jgi:uncharacterized cysteine cluster protein YcgN (CxxCxxCC family)
MAQSVRTVKIKSKKKASKKRPRKTISLPLSGEEENWNGLAAKRRLALKKKITGISQKHRELDRINRWMKKNLPPQGTPEWEALCTGCGVCCYDKVWIGSRLHLLKSACSFLNMKTNLCKCYEDRFEREPLCMPIDADIIQMGGLPADCPYVEGMPGYRPPKVIDKTIDEV